MDTDIALARLASGRAVPIGAECGCGVHDGPPGFVWKQAKRSMLGPPFSLQVSFTTVKCRATIVFYSKQNDSYGDNPQILLNYGPGARVYRRVCHGLSESPAVSRRARGLQPPESAVAPLVSHPVGCPALCPGHLAGHSPHVDRVPAYVAPRAPRNRGSRSHPDHPARP